MSFDDTLGDLFRQALQPVASARPPASVWRRVVHTVQSTPISRWSGFLLWVRGLGSPSLLSFSSLPVCMGPNGHCQLSPFDSVMLRQGLETRLAF